VKKTTDEVRYVKKQWEGSYTQAVVLGLERSWPVASTTPGNSVYEAVQLLKQYHRDLHIPYEQRDAARGAFRFYKEQAENAREEIIRLQRLLDLKAKPRPPLKEELQMARSVAAGNSLYGVVRVIDRALEEIKPFTWTVYNKP
jgi:hypothetical protein